MNANDPIAMEVTNSDGSKTTINVPLSRYIAETVATNIGSMGKKLGEELAEEIGKTNQAINQINAKLQSQPAPVPPPVPACPPIPMAVPRMPVMPAEPVVPSIGAVLFGGNCGHATNINTLRWQTWGAVAGGVLAGGLLAGFVISLLSSKDAE